METKAKIIETDQCVICWNHTDLEWRYNAKLDAWVEVCPRCRTKIIDI